MAEFDPATYVPYDPWEHASFLTRALTGPMSALETATPGEFTEPSYFEYRKPYSADRFAEVSVYATAGSTFEVALQRSFDHGATWHTVDTYSAGTETTIRITSLVMLRLLLVSATGTTVAMRLKQDL